MSDLTPSSESENSSDDEIVKFLKSRDDTKTCVAKFKATQERIRQRAKATIGDTNVDGRRDSLCHICRKITISALRATGYYLPGSFDSLQRSAATCAVCRLILTSLRCQLAGLDDKLAESSGVELKVNYHDDGILDYSFVKRSSPRLHVNEVFLLTMAPQPDGVIHIKARIRKLHNKTSFLDISSKTMIYTTKEDICKRFQIPMDPRSKGEDKFGLMEQWLKEDTTPLLNQLPSFDNGTTSYSSLSFPSRLIYLGPFTDLHRCQLRLVSLLEASRLSRAGSSVVRPRYVTLSHRWGPSRHFITTKANLSARSQGFAFEELPQTYKDAAIVSARLGFQFLWIDAVCIVQDDPAEWLQESEMMGDIFRYACFTIASTCSENDSQGFLREAFRKRGSTKLNKETYPSTFMRAAADLEMDVAKSPLSKRGWVLQERFLSMRLLHFTIGMIYWETTYYTRSEDGFLQDARPKHGNDVGSSTLLNEVASLPSSLRTLQQFQLRASVSLLDFSTWFNALPKATSRRWARWREQFGTKWVQRPPLSSRSPVEWHHLVEMYSTCSLTEAKDKLMAISGIAKVLQRQRSVAYLAGIWVDRLPTGLWWLHVGPRSWLDPWHERASSWSWASKDGPIQFPLADERLQFRSDCEFVGVDAADDSWLNGPGSLHIRTKVLDLRKPLDDRAIGIDHAYQSIFQESLPIWEDDSKALWTINDPPLRLFNVSNARCFTGRRRRISIGEGKAWCIFDLDRDYTTPVLCASMAFFEGIPPRKEGLHLVLLLMASSEKATSFRRIGVGVIGEKFLKALNDNASYFNLRFEEQTITLV